VFCCLSQGISTDVQYFETEFNDTSFKAKSYDEINWDDNHLTSINVNSDFNSFNRYCESPSNCGAVVSPTTVAGGRANSPLYYQTPSTIYYDAVKKPTGKKVMQKNAQNNWNVNGGNNSYCRSIEF
jgi:hypothetical protein